MQTPTRHVLIHMDAFTCLNTIKQEVESKLVLNLGMFLYLDKRIESDLVMDAQPNDLCQEAAGEACSHQLAVRAAQRALVQTLAHYLARQLKMLQLKSSIHIVKPETDSLHLGVVRTLLYT